MADKKPSKLDDILDANRARELAAQKELTGVERPDVDVIDALQSGRDQLTGGAGSRLEQAAAAARGAATGAVFDKGYHHPDTDGAPELPNNRGNSPPSLVAAPSSDPSDWVSGSASNGLVFRNRDTRTGVTTYRAGNGDIYQFWGDNMAVWKHHSDGGRTVIYYREATNGKWKETHRAYHLPDEGPDDDFTLEIGPAVIERKQSKPEQEKQKEGLVRTQDPGADPSSNPAGEHYYHGARKPAPEVTKVNPGPDGAAPQPAAAQLRPKDLNTDPWRESDRVSQETADRLREHLPNRPGPGGHPGDPDGPKEN